MSTPITEVPARSGHRRWVYGALDPARPIEIKPVTIPAPEWFIYDLSNAWARALGPIKKNLVELWARDLPASPLHEITAAEYRAHGIR